MLGYVTIGTNDLDKALAFYDPLFAVLGGRRMMEFMPQGVIYGTGEEDAALGIMKPYDGQPAQRGNGWMAALKAPTRAKIAEVHAKALELGGSDEGAPGIRGDDPNGFYAANFRDPEGNKFCAYRMGPPEA